MRIRADIILIMWVVVMLLPATLRANGVEIQELPGKAAKSVWLVEDSTLPMVTVRMAFYHAGSAYDPSDRQGVAHMLANLLDKGAGEMDNLAFKRQLESKAIEVSYSIDKDNFYISFRALKDQVEEAFKLVMMSVLEPRLEGSEIERMREQLVVSLAQKYESPNYLAAINWNQAMYGKHPYHQALHGTETSLKEISQYDLLAFKDKHLYRGVLMMSVVGDIDRQTLERLLRQYVMPLPESSAQPFFPVRAFTASGEGSKVLVERDIPQSVAVFGHAGISRHDPDFYAAYLLNYVLGGGGFESRLMQEVREKKGLAYSVYTYLYNLDNASLFRGGVGTRREKLAESLAVIEKEIIRLRDEGISEQVLHAAQRYITGSFILELDSARSLTNYLSFMQLEHLGKDYLTKRNQHINAVTVEDVKRVAKRLLKPESLVTVIVGKE